VSDPADLAIFRRDPALALLDDAELGRFVDELDQQAVTAGTVVAREDETSHDLLFVLEGEASVERRGLVLAPLRPGDHFGVIGLLTDGARAATVTARTPLRLARMTRARYATLRRAHPELALCFVEALTRSIARSWMGMTDRVGVLLDERLLPRRAEISVLIEGERRAVAPGTRVGQLLPERVGEDPVVAALLDDRPVSLDTPVAADAWLAPVALSSWEGREVFRRSARLLLLAAVERAHPEWDVRLAPALTSFQPIAFLGEPVDAGDFVQAVRPTLRHFAEEKIAFREETWTLSEARELFARRGWTDAARLLDTWRDDNVTLAQCGGVHALRIGPLVPHAGFLAGIDVAVHGDTVILDFGEHGNGAFADAPRGADERATELSAPRFGGPMVASAARWQSGLGITSVGELNGACVAGRVDEIIRVAEGFHEKRIGQLADEIVAKEGAIRIITIAGPSSSGKTTFIKRLMTQLEVAGMRPHAVSLDDYYVDRERTPRDASGAYDFEVIDALDLPALARDVRALLGGDEVALPRFDFKLGKSEPGAGERIALGRGEILLLEGMHGLNPKLLGDAAPPGRLFRVFIHPASTLPLDRASRIAPEDVRLLRRLVRDRHGRGIATAENISRWPAVRRGELLHIYPFLPNADVIFDSSLVYEPCVLKVYAERYLLEVPPRHPSHTVAQRLRQLADRFIAIYPDHVPPTSIVREFIGGSGFEY
jgi:uridine kinase